MNEHLRLAIGHLHEGVQVFSYDWRCLYVNETAALHGRRSAAELAGERMHDGYQSPDLVLLDVASPGEHHSALMEHIERTGYCCGRCGTRCAIRQTGTSRPPRRRQKSRHTQTMSL